MATFNWLHLSDWHQRKDGPNRQVVLKALSDDIRSRESISKTLKKLDFVVFSGDLAFSGKKSEYEAAQDFIQTILDAAELTKEKLIVVPGNHDVDRSEVRFLDKQVTLRLTEDDVEAIRSHQNPTVFSPMNAYSKWLEVYQIPCAPNPVFFANDGDNVALIKLNSAWLSSHNQDCLGVVDDYGHLIIGEHCVIDLIHKAKKENPKLIIAVVHHPLSWLTMRDKMPERSRLNRLLRRECHFVLHGHEHEPDVVFQTSPLGQCVFVPAGASYDRREFANGYNFCSVDLNAWRFQIFLRRFNQVDTWLEDTATTGDGVGGLWSSGLPKFKGILDQNPPETPVESTSPPVEVKSSNPDSALHIPATVLGSREGLIALWLNVNPRGQGIREMGNNRHLLGHDKGPPYSNVFSLSCGPDDFHQKPADRKLSWKLWLANSNKDQRTWMVEDTLGDGWHHFAITWNMAESRLILYIDAEEVDLRTQTGQSLTEADYKSFWPNLINDQIIVGTWTDKSDVHFIETSVCGIKQQAKFLSQQEVLQLFDDTRPKLELR